ncbi:bifunctional diaminohydroxyphosphoribosylaminopyrimidine deaminase/5-amino-6-(5-phosphoribosylamino)uracil reductase RibD [Alkalicaulis satelles]|uniref:diaminohydroxyphosphoribosylaminopyrimidine deaminase n=1 Tax=Alkalicaulis satelles TaxID=2609175 RepID=A0A5M6ZFB5_9PROT|nr:bifunctional diaminohydroxyphosphoribosylaminopyrimidine deaminase/5-amino-6-(5-phosphoribosylamino)uracil reductase RibD [Alkalicaulis satelles]KAA5802457.1 bifunctional diaminohydroxyphosphoribosylaminopyrimidine deaminase/5-amino-6-(5-phosphoribosylamino)uracil reductase RibD [Alkalicaulis satelles]
MGARAVTPDDLRFMDAALALAYARLGRTAPNPSVGCVIVKDRRVIAAAATAPSGRPHAETQALDMAGEDARGARIYVTLEPCAHHGQTPPCAEALAAAGVGEVVIACRDPDARVSGRGIAILSHAGIAVLEGVRSAQAEALNAGFFTRLVTGRPLLVQDGRAGLFDADLELRPDESLDMALDRMGREGLTRVRIPAP